MNKPDQDHIDAVILWISYAEEDFGLAKFALKMPSSRPYRLIAFHAQQCAEKYLKAYLVYHDIDFPYRHNIKKLLDLCGSHKWVEEIKGIATKNEAEQAVDMASVVREIIRKVLIDEGLTIKEDAFR